MMLQDTQCVGLADAHDNHKFRNQVSNYHYTLSFLFPNWRYTLMQLRHGHLAVQRIHKARSIGLTAALLSTTAILLTGGVVEASQAAASGKSPQLNGAGKTIVVTDFADTSDPQALAQWHNYLANQFRKTTGATVKFLDWTSTTQELDALDEATVTDSGPDVFNIGSSFTPVAWGTGIFKPLTPSEWAAVGGKNRYYPHALTMSGPSPSQEYAVPATTGAFEMLYNKTLFAKAGISNPPTTWNEFVTDAEKITNPSQGVYGTAIDPLDPYDPWHTYWLLTQQMGQQFISSNLKTAEVDTPKVQQAVEFYFDWYTKYHIVPPSSLTWTSQNMLAAFTSGKIGMLLLQNLSDLTALKNAHFQWAYAPNPTIPFGYSTLPPGGKPADSYVIGQYWGIAKYSHNKPLDLAFINLYTSTKAQVKMQALTANQPANVAAGTIVAKKEPIYTRFIQGEQASYPTPFTPAWGDFEVAIASATSSIASSIAANKYSPSVVASELRNANSVFQSHL